VKVIARDTGSLNKRLKPNHLTTEGFPFPQHLPSTSLKAYLPQLLLSSKSLTELGMNSAFNKTKAQPESLNSNPSTAKNINKHKTLKGKKTA
jgi:hypothetical protein